MTGKLEDELRRVLADPPVPGAGTGDIGGHDIAGTLATLDRRVTRARTRRRTAAGLSVAAVLASGLAGATSLGGGVHPAAPDGRALSGGYGSSASAAAPDRGAAGPRVTPMAEVPGPVPAEVSAAARDAVAEVTGATVSGPVHWVRTDGGYLVQIMFTAPVTCRYCHDPAAGRSVLRGPVLEVQVPASQVPAATPAPGSSPPRAGSDGSAVLQGTTRLLSLDQATDLSRYGPVGEFTLPPAPPRPAPRRTTR